MSDLAIHADHRPAIVNPANDVGGICRFDFGSLPPEDAQTVRECGERIRAAMKKIAESVIAIGRELDVVKKTLGHGRFQAFVQTVCGFSLRTAQNYMRVARLAAKNANVAFLPLGTAYRMGGRRTSRWMLNTAAGRVADGEEMTEAAVELQYRMLLNARRRRARHESRGLDRNADRKSEGNVRAPIAGQSSRAVVADISRPPFQEDRPLPKSAVSVAEYCVSTYGEDIWRRLLCLWRWGELDDLMRALRKKLRSQNADEPGTVGAQGRL